MKKIYSGKTKDVFLCEDHTILLRFKDAVTGTEGTVDSGGNEVVGEVEGKGSASLSLTLHFFSFLEKSGVRTHCIGRGPGEATMRVRRARSFGLEVICRVKAWGSFLQRYGKFVSQGTPLHNLVEFSLKDDDRGDPFASEDTLTELGVASADQVCAMKNTAKRATSLIGAYLGEMGLELIDIKYEFGVIDGQVVLIDEVSGDSMRVAKGGKILGQKELAQAVLGFRGDQARRDLM